MVWCSGKLELFEAFEVCQHVQRQSKDKHDQTEVCKTENKSNICLQESTYIDGGGGAPPPSVKSRKRGGEQLRKTSLPTPIISSCTPHTRTLTVHGLYEKILNLIRICKFHELVDLLLNFLTGCQNNLDNDIWLPDRWIRKTVIPGWTNSYY